MRRSLMIIPIILSFLALSAVAEEQATDQQAAGDQWKTASAPGFAMKYRVKGDRLECSVKSGTTGWIAVGFNTINRMNGARIVIGCVDNKGLKLAEHKGKGHGHTALKEQKLGDLFGEERNNQTEISFSMPLDNGEKDSLVLKEGNKYHVILAVGKDDNMKRIHARKVSLTIVL